MKYKGYIYRHWIINDKGIEKSYIGITTETLNKRWGNDGCRYLKDTTKFSNAIKKYGWNNFEHSVIGIVEADTKEQLKLDLDEWEIYYIEKYNSFKNGYNSTKGGDGVIGFRFSDEQKKKMSNNRKGKYTGELHPMYGKRGELSPNYGRQCSKETKNKISKALKGKYVGEKASAYGRCGELNYMYGRYGELNPFYGCKHSEESKKKMSEAKKGKTNITASKKVKCLNTGQIFINQKEAGKWCGLKAYSNIGACCRKEKKHAGRHPETNELLEWEYCQE